MQRSLVQFTNLPNLALPSYESSFSSIALNWGCFRPEHLILFISYTYVLGTFARFLFGAFAPPSLFLGALHPLSILGFHCTSLVLETLNLSVLRVTFYPPFLGCLSGLSKLGCEHFMTLCFFVLC